MFQLDTNEQIVAIIHRHWFVISGRLSILTVFLLPPIIALLLAGAFLSRRQRSLSASMHSSCCWPVLLFGRIFIWICGWWQRSAYSISNKRDFLVAPSPSSCWTMCKTSVFQLPAFSRQFLSMATSWCKPPAKVLFRSMMSPTPKGSKIRSWSATKNSVLQSPSK